LHSFTVIALLFFFIAFSTLVSTPILKTILQVQQLLPELHASISSENKCKIPREISILTTTPRKN